MRTTTDLFIVLCYTMRVVSSMQASSNNKMNHRGMGKRVIQNINFFNVDRAAYPEPLPTRPENFILSPYKTIYQGLRYENDTRVFRKRFEYEPMLRGQQVVCQGLFDCIISHIAIESTEAIPVLLRGGAGYRHFTAVVKAKPGHELKGQVRAYCRNNYVPAKTRRNEAGDVPRRKFFFGDLLEEENWM